MITHAERTEQLYGLQDHLIEARSCFELPALAEALPDEILDLPFDIISGDYPDNILEERYYDQTGVLELADSLSRIGIGLRNVARKIVEGKPLNNIEAEIVKDFNGYGNDVVQRLTGNEKYDALDPFTLGDLAKLVKHHYARFDDFDARDHWQDSARETKARFLEHLDGTAAAELIPDPVVRKKMKETVQNTPVAFVDPFQVLADGNIDSFEVDGLFDFHDRKVTVVVTTDNIIGEVSAGFNTQLTTYHELLHACVSRNYKKQDSAADANSYKVKPLIPLPEEEAIIEKIAYAFITDDIRNSTLNVDRRSISYFYSDSGRKAMDNLSSPAIFTPDGTEEIQDKAKHFVPSVYFDYRMLYDAVFARIPWERAGVTSKQAQGLLANAIFEQPDSALTGPEKWPHRKAFFEKARMAGAEGVFNRIGSAVNTLGLERTLEIVASDIDILHPLSFPHSTHLAKVVKLSHQEKRARQRLYELEEIGSPQDIIDTQKAYIQRLSTVKKATESQAERALGLSIYVDTKLKRRNVTSNQPLRRATVDGLAEHEYRALETYMKKRR